MTANICDKRITPYLQEVEDAVIVPAIGADLYEKLDAQKLDNPILLNGGYYDAKCGERKICHGLRKTTAYLAYSKMLKANKVSVTAFGVVEKTGTYSQSANQENVNYVANHAAKMGDFYLKSCVDYLQENAQPSECGCQGAPARHRSTIMQTIVS